MHSTIEAGSVHLFGTPREVHPMVLVNKGNNKITEHRAIFSS